MPDEELFQLAEQGQLSRHETLREQVERMLRDPKANAFAENFAGQWLGLREIDATLPDRQLYPEYDELLRSSMITEGVPVLRGSAEERPEPDELRLLRLQHHQRASGKPLRHSGGRRARVPQSLAAGEQSPRRGHDDGRCPEGDGQRHDHFADRARGLGPRPPPGDAASQATRQRGSRRARHPRRDDDPQSTCQNTGKWNRARNAT